MYLDDCTEELLDAHEAELKELQQYYDSYKQVFQKVAIREDMWMKFLAYEVRIDLITTILHRWYLTVRQTIGLTDTLVFCQPISTTVRCTVKCDPE